MKEKIKKIDWVNLLKPLFIIASIMYATPSIIYMVKNKTVQNFDQYFKFFLDDSDRLEQTLVYILILAVLTILYFLIIKNKDKLFKNIKEMYIFIGISAAIYILVIPFMCSDVFYYLGIGRIDSKYGQNPYYTTITQFVENGENSKYLDEDTVLAQGAVNDWADTTVVYGPVWTLICKIVSGITFGNINFALFVFKLISVILHLINCYLIYKITKKKIFVLIYGLNPFMMLEGIVSVNNDLYVVTFVLLSLYFLLKRKNIVLSVLFLALATSIKYFTILLLPFIIIYYFRNEKPLQRFKNCIIYGILFAIFVSITYLLYVQDWTVLMGLFTQQEKFAKNFYIILMEYFQTIPNVVEIVNKTLLIGFVIIYFFTCVTLLNKKQIKFREQMNIVNYFLLAFIFLLITNFQPWYLMWLMPIVMWQKPNSVRLMIEILIVSQFANSIFLLNGEGWKNGTPFTFAMVLGILICVLINQKREIISRKRRIRRLNNG